MNPFKTKTLGGITASFTKTLNELDALITNQVERHRSNREQIAALTQDNRDIDSDITKASKVRQNIAQLIEEN